MYQRLGPKGFVVLGFPCNQFGGQEPGTPAEIKAFTDGYGVTFPLFSKVDVNGPNTHPLFAYLKKQKGEMLGDDIKWNFVSRRHCLLHSALLPLPARADQSPVQLSSQAKFLIGKDGTVLQRYGPPQSPSTIENDVVKALEKAFVKA